MWKWWQIVGAIFGTLYVLNIIIQLLFNDAPSYKVRKIKYIMESFDNIGENVEQEKDPEYQIPFLHNFQYAAMGMFNIINYILSLFDFYVKDMNNRIYNEFIYKHM